MLTEQLKEDLLEDADEQVEREEMENQAGGEALDQDDRQEEDDQPDEVVVTIGDEEPPEEQDDKAAPQWVKNLRKEHREAQRELRELRAKVAEVPKPKTPEVGKKPTLEGCDYDPEKFEQDLTAWHERKREADQVAKQQEADQKAQQEAWNARLESYATARSGLKVKDFEDAEVSVQGALNMTQQGIIVQGAENAALVVYALGKNPKKAAELAAINDPVKFAFAIAKLETQLKVQNRKSPPAPEKTVSGTGKISGSVDSNLERLRAEAEKTGDYSKVSAYKRQQKAKSQK